ncbi:MAG: hypothetical protein WD607_02215, partial [Candidatus Paceibacterota bacterium]
METVKIELEKLLKTVSDSRDLCIERLSGSVKNRKGILTIKKDETITGKPLLSISFDSEIISEFQVKKIVQETANALNQTFGHFHIKIKELKDSRRLEAASDVLKNMKGVMNVLIVPTG